MTSARQALLALVVVAAICGISLIVVLLNPTEDDHTCGQYADWALKDVPARCVSYFTDPTQQGTP